MTFQVPVNIPDNVTSDDSLILDEQIIIQDESDSVSGEKSCVSNSHIRLMVRKVAKILTAQGVSCCECPRTQYKLYSLSDCEDGNLRYSLKIDCPDGRTSYQFELTLAPTEAIDKPNISESKKGR